MSGQVTEVVWAEGRVDGGEGFVDLGSYTAVLIWLSIGLGALFVGLVGLKVTARGFDAMPADPSSATTPVGATPSRAVGG